MRARTIFMQVAWPAFLAACGLELLVFAMVDPRELQWPGQLQVMSRQTVYTAAFFAFWLIAAGACAITALLGQPTALPEDRRGDAAS
ncbi:MAG: hypothetical protein EOO25_03415 [Comamonadaceae bacterium]|nr:MAG: hypothetical protein EOO25_03415 [Comamonadaceae bacterium]